MHVVVTQNDDKSCTYVSDAIWKFVNIPEQKTDQVDIGQFHILISTLLGHCAEFYSFQVTTNTVFQSCVVCSVILMLCHTK